MSNFVKFILMALAWLVLYFGTYYGCIQPEYCPETPTVTVDPSPVPVDEYTLRSSMNSPDILKGALWESELQSLYDRYQRDPKQALEVTGYYFPGEKAPDEFSSMGLYRAEEIKQLLIAKGVPADNIRGLDRQKSGAAPAAGEPFDIAGFAWARMTGDDDEDDKPKVEIVEVSDAEFDIRFPFSKNTAELNAEAEAYLKKLAERVAQTKETISITGHTDNVDSEAFNMQLGQQRADFIRERLVAYGVDANLIDVSSQGLNSPKASNATAEGRRINRRATILLNKTQ